MFTTGTTPSDDHRELPEARLLKILRFSGMSGSADGDGLRLDLLHAAAGADRLIVEADSGLLLLGIRPFRKDGIRKRGAGAGNIRSCLGAHSDETAVRCENGEDSPRSKRRMLNIIPTIADIQELCKKD